MYMIADLDLPERSMSFIIIKHISLVSRIKMFIPANDIGATSGRTPSSSPIRCLSSQFYKFTLALQPMTGMH